MDATKLSAGLGTAPRGKAPSTAILAAGCEPAAVPRGTRSRVNLCAGDGGHVGFSVAPWLRA